MHFRLYCSGLRPADGVFRAVLVPSVDTTVLVVGFPVSVKKRFVRFSCASVDSVVHWLMSIR